MATFSDEVTALQRRIAAAGPGTSDDEFDALRGEFVRLVNTFVDDLVPDDDKAFVRQVFDHESSSYQNFKTLLDMYKDLLRLIVELEAEIEDIKRQLADARERNREFEAEVERLKDEIKRLNLVIADLRAQLEQLLIIIQGLEKRIADLEGRIKELEGERGGADTQLAAAQRDLNQAKDDLEKARAAAAAAEQAKNDAEREKGEKDNTIQRLEDEKRALEEQIAVAERVQAKKEREKEAAKVQSSQTRTQLNTLLGAASDLERQMIANLTTPSSVRARRGPSGGRPRSAGPNEPKSGGPFVYATAAKGMEATRQLLEKGKLSPGEAAEFDINISRAALGEDTEGKAAKAAAKAAKAAETVERQRAERIAERSPPPGPPPKPVTRPPTATGQFTTVGSAAQFALGAEPSAPKDEAALAAAIERQMKATKKSRAASRGAPSVQGGMLRGGKKLHSVFYK
jgi:hypothetical protein